MKYATKYNDGIMRLWRDIENIKNQLFFARLSPYEEAKLKLRLYAYSEAFETITGVKPSTWTNYVIDSYTAHYSHSNNQSEKNNNYRNNPRLMKLRRYID